MSAQKQVSPDDVDWWEVAASGSPANRRVLLVAAYQRAPVVATDATVAAPEFHAGPNLLAGDPFAASYTTFDGRIFVGGMVGGSLGDPGGIRFTYYDLANGTDWASNPISAIANDGYTDKPWLAIGPSSVPFGEINHYVMSMRAGTGCSGDKVWVYRSPISSLFTPWANNSVVPVNAGPSDCESTATCNYKGWGSMPIVTDDGDIIAVVRDANIVNGGPGCYNERRPYFIWSDDDGLTWQPGNSEPVALGQGLVEAIGTKIDPQYVSDTPYYVNRRANAPSMAIDRATNTAYVAFAARRDMNHSAEADWNSDIWVFRGSKNPQTNEWVFGIDPSYQVLHLTDEMLGLSPGTTERGMDQFMPAIAIDCAGAINLMFYDNRAETEVPTIPDASNPDGRQVQVYYARITGWPNGTTSVYTKALTPDPFTVYPSDAYLGDYHTIAVGGSTGQWLYPVYIATRTINPPPENPASVNRRVCFTHSVFIRLCIADTNLNRMADSNDLDVFWDAYSEGENLADVTDDGYVNSEDVDEFIDVYSDAIGN